MNKRAAGPPHGGAERHPGRHHAHHDHVPARRRARRRKRLRALVFAAAALLAPHHPKPAKPRAATSLNVKTAPTRVAGEGVTVRPDPRIYEPLIREAAVTHRLDPTLIRGVIRFESAFDPLAVSRAGAQGLMQLMPAVAARLGVRDILNPRENIMAGSRYLRELLDRHHGRVDLALASYNAGPTAVDRYHAVPPFPETLRYVKAITGFIKRNHTESEEP